MNGLWDILSVAIGVSFVFMILSILNSWIQDYVATIFHLRAYNLADIMQVLLEPGALRLNGPGRAKAPPEAVEYTTQEKETLSQIAGYFNVSPDNLLNANLNILDNLPFSDKDDKSELKLKIPKVWVDQYKVQEKETIRSISDNLDGVTSEDLRKQNLEVLIDLPLTKGTQITIPEHPYEVKENDTINSIAKDLKDLNDLKDPKVDSKGLAEKNLRFLEGLSLPSKTNITFPGHSYEVKENDAINSIASIANKFGVKSEDLAEKNLEALYDIKLTEARKGVIERLNITKKPFIIPEHFYTVKENDTINSIAKDLGVSSKDLAEKKPEVIGDSLPLPKDKEIKIPTDSYKLQKEDTMTKIAEKFGRPADVEALRQENLDLLKEKMLLNPKKKLTIPEPKAGQYTVRANDTIASIAKKFGMSIEDLQKENKNLRKINPQVPIATLPGLPITSLRIPRPKIGQMTSRTNNKLQLIANPVGSVYSHPNIHSLSRPNELPDRIPTMDFTVALLDILDDIGKGKKGKISGDKINIKNIMEGINSLENEGGAANTHPLAFRLRSLLYTAQINTQIKKAKDNEDASLEEFQKAVSEWFDDTVARGSLWYKRKMQRIGILFGILLAVVLNADTIGISNALWHNAILRESISQAAEASTQQGQAPDSEQAQAQLEELMDLGLPIGWSLDSNPDDPRAIPSTTEGWISKSIGLLLTGFAISQGSQLWFDLINRLINIRSSVSKSDTDESPAKSKGK